MIMGTSRVASCVKQCSVWCEARRVTDPETVIDHRVVYGRFFILTYNLSMWWDKTITSS